MWSMAPELIERTEVIVVNLLRIHWKCVTIFFFFFFAFKYYYLIVCYETIAWRRLHRSLWPVWWIREYGCKVHWSHFETRSLASKYTHTNKPINNSRKVKMMLASRSFNIWSHPWQTNIDFGVWQTSFHIALVFVSPAKLISIRRTHRNMLLNIQLVCSLHFKYVELTSTFHISMFHSIYRQRCRVIVRYH